MMAAILNSAILDSAILHKTLTQTISIWHKLIHFDSTWWWQPSWILPSWIQPFCPKKTSLIHSDSTWWLQLCWNLPTSIQPFCIKRTSLIHSDSTWWWQPSWILPCWIQPFCTKLWLKLFQFDTNSFILTQLDDGSHLEFCHHGFSHFAQNKTSLIHSHSNWWWQPYWILPCWIQTLPSWIQTPCYLLSDSLKNTLPPLWLWLKLIPSD